MESWLFRRVPEHLQGDDNLQTSRVRAEVWGWSRMVSNAMFIADLERKNRRSKSIARSGCMSWPHFVSCHLNLDARLALERDATTRAALRKMRAVPSLQSGRQRRHRPQSESRNVIVPRMNPRRAIKLPAAIGKSARMIFNEELIELEKRSGRRNAVRGWPMSAEWHKRVQEAWDALDQDTRASFEKRSECSKSEAKLKRTRLGIVQSSQIACVVTQVPSHAICSEKQVNRDMLVFIIRQEKQMQSTEHTTSTRYVYQWFHIGQI